MKNRVAPVAAVFTAAALLTSCGGGDGPGTPTPTPTSTPTPTLDVTLSATSADVTVEEGGSATFGFDATYTGSSNDPVVADVTVNARRYSLVGTPSGSGKTFTVNLGTVPFPAGGLTSTDVVFRLCKTSACNTVYPGSTKKFTVNLDVQVKDWATFQRNAAHTGYVPVRYNAANFKKAWEWTDTDPTSWIRPPAAARGRILVTVGRDGGMAYSQTARLYAFKPSGSVDWTYDLGDQFQMSGPALSNGMVHVTSMETSSPDNPQWVFDLENGTFLNQMKFASQWHDFNQPTAVGNQVIVAAGYYGTKVYSYDAANGTKQWELERTGGSWANGKTVAMDAENIYYPANVALDVIDRKTGVIKQSIADPDISIGDVSSFESAPVIGDGGVVFLFSGEKRFLSQAKIMAVSPAQNKILWKSNAEYTTDFAVAGETIYAVRNDAFVLAALDAKTGKQIWAVPLPVSEGLYGGKSFHGNVVVTENLVFVSDHDTTWAIDLKNDAHPIVWEAPTGGRLIITPDNQLLTTGVRDFRKLTVYNLF